MATDGEKTTVEVEICIGPFVKHKKLTVRAGALPTHQQLWTLATKVFNSDLGSSGHISTLLDNGSAVDLRHVDAMKDVWLRIAEVCVTLESPADSSPRGSSACSTIDKTL